MTAANRRRKADVRYFLTFAGTAGLLVSGTLVLVLYVLPQRYVLSSGFMEGSLNFPEPTVPFEPLNPRVIAAISAPTVDEVVRGPAELFWEQVLPLLAAERWDDAIGLFALYLGSYPDDRGVQREFALTLTKAGYSDRAIPILERLLDGGHDPSLRLLLARTLRDADRVQDAGRHYRVLLDATPADEDLILEWAGALSWEEEYAGAIDVLRAGLVEVPGSPRIRAELARLLYLSGDLTGARALLLELSPEQLAEDGSASLLLRTVVAELTPPPPPPEEVVEPTTLERAVRAREEGRLDEAEALFRAALEANPDSFDAWQAYADFLQYERLDLGAALAALYEVERLDDREVVAGRDYRLAQLEAWTDDLRRAEHRLLRLIPNLPGPPIPVGTEETEADPPVAMADALSLLGDVLRWQGDRGAAAERYVQALAEDPNHVEAAAGLERLRADTQRALIEAELPGIGGIVESFADTDDFRRLDLGGAWRGIDGSWVWGTRTGARVLRGIDLSNASGDLTGAFAELEGGRWWRRGTLRTTLRMGAQTIRPSATDLSVGATFRQAGADGARTDIDVDYEPAHVSANTLQSAVGDVRQARVAFTHNRPLSGPWSLSAAAEAASLDHRELSSDRNLRAAVSASVGRSVGSGWSSGVSVRALGYTEGASVAGVRPLYWDPELSLATGPFVQWQEEFGALWRIEARATPGVGLIRERATGDSQFVPDLSATFRTVRDGARYRTLIEVVYGQGRFDGYRSFGLNLSFSARGWTGTGGGS
ncbi:MAG: tetratricopeptide repeat protein [Gemmatimonadota bacterium]